MSAVEKTKIGVIGYGFRSKGMVKGIIANGNYQVIAVVDIDKKSLQEAKNNPALEDAVTYNDYTKLLEMDEIEAVFIFTPQYTHRDITVAAFETNKSVYCEKPMALTVRECNDMIEAGEKAGKVLMIGQQMRYHAHLNKMKSFINAGKIGKPIMLWLKEFRNPFPQNMLWAFDKKKSGGLFVEKNCHHFDLFNWFSDSKPLRVFASASKDVIKKPFGIKSNILDNGWVTVEYENGVRAMLGICMFAGPAAAKEGKGTHVREIGIMGEEGMMRTEGFDLGTNVEIRYRDGKKFVYKAGGKNGNEKILERFTECIRKNIQPEASGEIGKMAVCISLAVEKSAQEKRVIKI